MQGEEQHRNHCISVFCTSPLLLPQVSGCAPHVVPGYHLGQEDELNLGTCLYLLSQLWDSIHLRVRCRMPAAMNPDAG